VTLLIRWFAFGRSFELPGFNFGGVENLREIKPNPVPDPMKGKPSLGTPAAYGPRRHFKHGGKLILGEKFSCHLVAAFFRRFAHFSAIKNSTVLPSLAPRRSQ
jgi:hypothetical protein